MRLSLVLGKQLQSSDKAKYDMRLYAEGICFDGNAKPSFIGPGISAYCYSYAAGNELATCATYLREYYALLSNPGKNIFRTVCALPEGSHAKDANVV